MVGTRSLSSGAHSRDPLALPTLRFSGSPYFASTGSGGTLSLGAPACMVISVIDVMS
jgi:hypothetical protein